jgi:hypothetical protein
MWSWGYVGPTVIKIKLTWQRLVQCNNKVYGSVEWIQKSYNAARHVFIMQLVLFAFSKVHIINLSWKSEEEEWFEIFLLYIDYLRLGPIMRFPSVQQENVLATCPPVMIMPKRTQIRGLFSSQDLSLLGEKPNWSMVWWLNGLESQVGRKITCGKCSGQHRAPAACVFDEIHPQALSIIPISRASILGSFKDATSVA